MRNNQRELTLTGVPTMFTDWFDNRNITRSKCRVSIDTIQMS